MKKVILLIMIALFSFSGSASANYNYTQNWGLGTVHTAGQKQLKLDVYTYSHYGKSVTVKLMKEGPAGQWTQVFVTGEYLYGLAMHQLTYNVGYLTSGNYKVEFDVSNDWYQYATRIDDGYLY
ncbi:hypothetical protein ACFQZE_09255 [Paenibacillus sp. GCM10027627]|uniref:hypothetical protein n=1 Tax=unclassified Paenibacillus TaxID=185978 RepID=UPI003639EA5A